MGRGRGGREGGVRELKGVCRSLGIQAINRRFRSVLALAVDVDIAAVVVVMKQLLSLLPPFVHFHVQGALDPTVPVIFAIDLLLLDRLT